MRRSSREVRIWNFEPSCRTSVQLNHGGEESASAVDAALNTGDAASPNNCSQGRQAEKNRNHPTSAAGRSPALVHRPRRFDWARVAHVYP